MSEARPSPTAPASARAAVLLLAAVAACHARGPERAAPDAGPPAAAPGSGPATLTPDAGRATLAPDASFTLAPEKAAAGAAGTAAEASAPDDDAGAGRPLPDRARLVALVKQARGFVAATDGRTHEHLVAAVHGDATDAPVLVASFTKLFVAVATLRLAARGALGLDDTVGALLPALAARPWADSTVRELLTHTSRVPEFDEHGGYYRKRGVDFADPVATLARELPRATERRGVFKYRNAEFALLGAILQTRGERPAAEVLAREVFGPAHMPHAGILVDRAPPGLDLAPMGPIRPQNFFTAGNGYATAEDLLAFFDALGDDTLLDAKARATLFAGDPARQGGALGCWSHPFEGRTLVERPGGFGNVRLVTAFFPEERRAVVAWSREPVELGRTSQPRSTAAALARLLTQ